MDKILEFICSPKFYLPIIYIAVGVIAYKLVAKGFEKGKKFDKFKSKRKDTIISLVRNIIKYIIALIVIIAILGVYGVNTTAILASLGVVAVVIGLAFQDIVKDFLSGISIIFDNKYSIGDIVEINGFKGEVIALGLMTTKIKAYTGEVKILSNSAFNELINYSLYDTKLIIDVSVSYNTNADKLEDVLFKMQDEILKIDNVKDKIEYLGLDTLGDSSVVYKMAIDCVAGTHLGVKRKVLKLLKKTLDENKIEIPYNKLDVYVKNEK